MDLSKLIVGNAAGTVKTVDDVRKLEKSAVTRSTVGSITKEPREGNSGETYYFDEVAQTSVNSIGLKNPGIEWYHAAGKLNLMRQIAQDNGKELWASVAGFSTTEFGELAETCFLCGVDGGELNLGCPNIHDGGTSHEIFSLNPELSAEILMDIEARFAMQGKQIGIKISPAPNKELAKLAHAITGFSALTEVNATNTFPKQRLLKPDGTEGLNFIPPGGKVMHEGGMSGAGLKKHSLRAVKIMRAAFLHGTRIVAPGGIFTGTAA